MSADHVHRCRYCDEALATEESVLAKSAERSAAMAATVHGHNVKLVEERKTLRAALAASQAELAESVRALAKSQDEAKGWMKVYGKQIQTSAGLALELSAARGDLERARGLLARWLNGGGDTPAEEAATELGTRAFLAPTASPEPDRASPEVTVKEPSK